MNACPENLGNWSSSPQNELELSPRPIQSCFPLPYGSSCRKPPSALFRSNWVKYDYDCPSYRKKLFSTRWTIVIVFDPVGSKKCWRWSPATGPLKKRETAVDRSWRKLQLILRRGRPISKIFGASVHANVLKGTFSTDCTSNCIIIGLRYRILSRNSEKKHK